MQVRPPRPHPAEAGVPPPTHLAGGADSGEARVGNHVGAEPKADFLRAMYLEGGRRRRDAERRPERLGQGPLGVLDRIGHGSGVVGGS